MDIYITILFFIIAASASEMNLILPPVHKRIYRSISYRIRFILPLSSYPIGVGYPVLRRLPILVPVVTLSPRISYPLLSSPTFLFFGRPAPSLLLLLLLASLLVNSCGVHRSCVRLSLYKVKPTPSGFLPICMLSYR